MSTEAAPSDAAAAVRAARQFGACAACIALLATDTDAAAAAAHSAASASADADAPAPECTVCYGALQLSSAALDAALASAFAPARGGMSGATSARLTVTLPLGHAVRRAQLRATLTRAKLSAPGALDVKDALKEMAGARLTEAFGIAVDPDSQLELRLSWLHSTADVLAERLCAAVPTEADAVGAVRKPTKRRRRGADQAPVDRSMAYPSDRTANEGGVTQSGVLRLLDRLGERVLDVLGEMERQAPGEMERQAPGESVAQTDAETDRAANDASNNANTEARSAAEATETAASTAAPCTGTLDVTFRHTSLWVGGRYIKLSRALSQSPWNVGSGTRVGITSVEELVAPPFVALFGASTHALRSSGREDLDVRMLGSGRPFMLEMVAPTRLDVTQAEIDAVVAAVHSAADGAVLLSNMCQLQREHGALLEGGDLERRKTYRCLVHVTGPSPSDETLARVNAMRDIELAQRTPLRVAHRRTCIDRERLVHRVRIERFAVAATAAGETVAAASGGGAPPKRNSCWLAVTLSTAAGTYVKEFVSSDLGRTTPSLCSLLGVRAAVIAQLDVLDVALEFPPRDVAPREPLSLPHVVVPLFTDPPSEEREHSNDDD